MVGVDKEVSDEYLNNIPTNPIYELRQYRMMGGVI